MSASPTDLALYTGAIAILFLTPGPVWVAITARAMAGGFGAAWPLALGVVVGDVLWPFLAILGIGWVVGVFAGFMTVLRWVAAAFFLGMGALILKHADRAIAADSRLTRPGGWAGFAAGVAVILGNPKAILFHMGVLPGFFDLTGLTWPDVGAIVLISLAIPLAGNLSLALLVHRGRALLASPLAVRRSNIVAGSLLILVGLAIPVV